MIGHYQAAGKIFWRSARFETRFHITLLPPIRNSAPSKYTDCSKSIHKNYKIAKDNKAHSLVAKTQSLIIFDKQAETKISERFGEFEYHCFDPYHTQMVQHKCWLVRVSSFIELGGAGDLGTG